MLFETARRYKDPGESLDYAHLFQLGPDDSIASAVAETVDASSSPVVNDLLLAPARFAALPLYGVWAVQARVSGGGTDPVYFIRWTALTANGQTHQTTTRLVVLQR